MIGDSNRVLIVDVDEFKKNELGARRRLVASGVEKATSRGFLSEVAYLGQKVCHESLLIVDDSSLFATRVAYWRRLLLLTVM